MEKVGNKEADRERFLAWLKEGKDEADSDFGISFGGQDYNSDEMIWEVEQGTEVGERLLELFLKSELGRQSEMDKMSYVRWIRSLEAAGGLKIAGMDGSFQTADDLVAGILDDDPEALGLLNAWLSVEAVQEARRRQEMQEYVGSLATVIHRTVAAVEVGTPAGDEKMKAFLRLQAVRTREAEEARRNNSFHKIVNWVRGRLF